MAASLCEIAYSHYRSEVRLFCATVQRGFSYNFFVEYSTVFNKCPSPVNWVEPILFARLANPHVHCGARDRNRTGTPAINESGGF